MEGGRATLQRRLHTCQPLASGCLIHIKPNEVWGRNMSRFSLVLALVASVGLAAASPGPVSAQSGSDEAIEKFYRGAQSKIVISGAVGSDYDMYARLITRSMTKYIPGNPVFTPQNMPGGGHLNATNWLYSIAPQDGSVLGMVAREIPNLALLKEPNARFDPVKFNWLGNPELSPQICAVILRRSGPKGGRPLRVRVADRRRRGWI